MGASATYEHGTVIPGTPYRVHRLIGSGGMGTVYDVEDTTIGKRYVLKTVNLAFAKDRDPAAIDALVRREGRTLAQLSHPHIVGVITAGKTSDRLGLPFLVMERLEGVTLRAMLKLRIPRPSAWQIMSELLDALYYLHHPDTTRPPMLHRDLKPENIFLAKGHDGRYRTKLLDLGIAVMLDGKAHGTHGTLAYMAPEQLRGERLSERTDLYQAACVFFEILAGQHPFRGAKTTNDWIEAHLRTTAPRVSQFVDVPARVDDVLAAALAKDPAERPRDAHAFMAALATLRESPESVAPVVSNATMEDLHTQIERQGQDGYEAYATGNPTSVGIQVPRVVSTVVMKDALGHARTVPQRGSDPPRSVPPGKGATVPLAASRPPPSGPSAGGAHATPFTAEVQGMTTGELEDEVLGRRRYTRLAYGLAGGIMLSGLVIAGMIVRSAPAPGPSAAAATEARTGAAGATGGASASTRAAGAAAAAAGPPTGSASAAAAAAGGASASTGANAGGAAAAANAGEAPTGVNAGGAAAGANAGEVAAAANAGGAATGASAGGTATGASAGGTNAGAVTGGAVTGTNGGRVAAVAAPASPRPATPARPRAEAPAPAITLRKNSEFSDWDPGPPAASPAAPRAATTARPGTTQGR